MTDLSAILDAIKYLGPFGVVVWIVWYVFTKMIPGLLEGHRKSVAEIAAGFAAGMVQSRTDFRETLSAQRADFAVALAAERDVRLQELVEQRRCMVAAERRAAATERDIPTMPVAATASR